MRKEISISTMENKDRWAVVFVSYDEGVRLPLEDMENIFGGSFLENVEKELEDSEPLFFSDDGERIQVITVPTLIDAVITADKPDKIALYNLLGAVEKMLVNIWD